MEWRPWFRFLSSAFYTFLCFLLLGLHVYKYSWFWGQTSELIKTCAYAHSTAGTYVGFNPLAFPCFQLLNWPLLPVQRQAWLRPLSLPSHHLFFLPRSLVKARFCEAGFSVKDQLTTGQHPMVSWPLYCF